MYPGRQSRCSRQKDVLFVAEPYETLWAVPATVPALDGPRIDNGDHPMRGSRVAIARHSSVLSADSRRRNNPPLIDKNQLGLADVRSLSRSGDIEALRSIVTTGVRGFTLHTGRLRWLDCGREHSCYSADACLVT